MTQGKNPDLFRNDIIGYSDFSKLCQVFFSDNWASGFAVKHDGVWVVPPPDDADATPAERAAMSRHPENDLTKPALAFPCSLNKLRKFSNFYGLGCIDPFDMVEFAYELGATTATSDKTTIPYLDQKHKYYSEELAVAVNIWVGLYGDDGEYKPKESHKAQLKKRLGHCGLSDAAVDRIATLVNPNKGGGAPVS